MNSTALQIDPLLVSDEAIPMLTVDVPKWAWGVVLLAALVVYFVTMENGAALGSTAAVVHEFFHDGRHFSGVPCH